MVEHERELVVRTAGALPVVKALCDRLGLVEAMRVDGRSCLVTNDETLPAVELFTAFKRRT